MQTLISNEAIDSVLRHREVVRAKAYQHALVHSEKVLLNYCSRS